MAEDQIVKLLEEQNRILSEQNQILKQLYGFWTNIVSDEYFNEAISKDQKRFPV